MIKKISVGCMLVMMIVLAACSPSPAAQAADGANQAAAGTPQPGQGQMNTETKLLLGTLNLEGTDNAVTKEQAAQLLPLWKALKTLTSSQTSSQDEINALYKQIEGTMSAGQTQAIDEMKLSFQSMGEVMQKLGITPEAGGFGGFGGSGTPSPELQATIQARIAQGGGNFGGGQGGPPTGGGNFGGGPPDGGGGGGQGFPGGGPGFEPGSGRVTSQSGTPVAGRGTGGRSRTNPALLDALIKLLTERAG